MRLIFVRHGDPDYEHDSLTETGRIEAALVADRLSGMDIKEFITSPLGRARETAEYTLKKTGRTAQTLEWTQEFFKVRILRPDKDGEREIVWDWLPQDWTTQPEFYDPVKWSQNPIMMEGHVGEEYDRVCKGLDDFLSEHGYRRDGRFYRAESPNRDTYVFFTHFGATCVFLSHLLNISPMTLWHGLCMAPSSVTSVYTEERREGIASFRANECGDVSHLYTAGREPSSHARFCETYSNMDERHD